jgi:hypothetical protein
MRNELGTRDLRQLIRQYSWNADKPELLQVRLGAASCSCHASKCIGRCQLPDPAALPCLANVSARCSNQLLFAACLWCWLRDQREPSSGSRGSISAISADLLLNSLNAHSTLSPKSLRLT